MHSFDQTAHSDFTVRVTTIDACLHVCLFIASSISISAPLTLTLPLSLSLSVHVLHIFRFFICLLHISFRHFAYLLNVLARCCCCALLVVAASFPQPFPPQPTWKRCISYYFFFSFFPKALLFFFLLAHKINTKTLQSHSVARMLFGAAPHSLSRSLSSLPLSVSFALRLPTSAFHLHTLSTPAPLYHLCPCAVCVRNYHYPCATRFVLFISLFMRPTMPL